jgi:hypothetical protein
MYRKAYISLFVAAISFLMSIPVQVSANAIIAIHDWDVTPDSSDNGLGNWAAQGSSATVSENTGNISDNYMEISFPGGIDSGAGDQWYETVSTPASDLFVGTWITDYWIEFDFWAQDVVPDTLQIRWGNTDSDRTWGNTITGSSGVGNWDTLRSDTFADYTDWKLDPYATEDQFMEDLEGIDWIGVYIFRDGTDAELYGVDDFKLMVPEPAEYLMLFAALGAAVMVIRRKKTS